MKWAFADQAVVSGVNFLTGLMLARFLGLQEFGIFTLAWALVLFLQGLQLALIVSPMMSIGPKQLTSQVSYYYGAVLTLQLGYSFVSFVLIGLVTAVTNLYRPDWGMGRIFLPLACAAVAFQLQEFVRRFLFTTGQPNLAFLNDAISYLGQLTLLVWLFNTAPMDSNLALWVIAVTSAIAALFGVRSLPAIETDKTSVGLMFARNWKFSRWMIGSAFVQWLSGHIFLFAAGGMLGAAVVGAMKSAQNIMGVMHILFQGLENIVPVQAARRLAGQGKASFKTYMLKVTAIGVFGSILFSVLIGGVSPEFLMRTFYGEEFASHSGLLVWYAVIYPLVFLSLMLRIWFRTFEYTRPIFMSYLIMTAVGLIVVYPLIMLFKEAGAMMGIMITNVIIVVSLLYSMKKYKYT